MCSSRAFTSVIEFHPIEKNSGWRRFYRMRIGRWGEPNQLRKQFLSAFLKEFTELSAKVRIGKCDSTFPSTHIGGSGANLVRNIFLRPISSAPLISQQIICPSH